MTASQARIQIEAYRYRRGYSTEPDSSDGGEAIRGSEAVTLPVNRRSYADLSMLVPGVRKPVLLCGSMAQTETRRWAALLRDFEVERARCFR